MRVSRSFKNVCLVFIIIGVFCPLSFAHGPISAPAVKIDVNSFPSIEDDLYALSYYSASAQRAGARLVERGVEILTQAHGVLSDPNAPLPQKLQLITVLGEIGDAGSVQEIIELANGSPKNISLQEYALVALPNFEESDEISGFVNQQLEDDSHHPVLIRNALGYYAKQRNNDAKQWVEKYTAPVAREEVRFAALYLGGTLGMDSVKSDIEALLQNKQRNTREYYLLMGFAHVATMDEFNALVNKNAYLNRDNVKKVREFLAFRLANAEEKKNLAPDLLNSTNAQLKQAVVKHLIEEKNADVLAANWQQGDGVVRAAVKRAGFTINEDEHGVSMDEVRKDNALSQWQIILILAVLSGVVFFGWFLGLRRKH